MFWGAKTKSDREIAGHTLAQTKTLHHCLGIRLEYLRQPPSCTVNDAHKNIIAPYLKSAKKQVETNIQVKLMQKRHMEAPPMNRNS